MEYDIIKENEVVYCSTEKDAKNVLKIANKLGLTWHNGEEYGKCTHWNSYRDESAYCLIKGTYSFVEYYLTQNYNIIQAKDFFKRYKAFKNKQKEEFPTKTPKSVNKQNTIEFVDGETYCRFNGVEMTPEECKKLYGFDGEFSILEEDAIGIDDTLYTNKPLCDVIILFGRVYGPISEYDNILDKGYGFGSYSLEASLVNTLVIPLRNLEMFKKIKPFEDFTKDYPKIDIEKYKEFYDCLDKFYKSSH